jgi:hypothetical protein
MTSMHLALANCGEDLQRAYSNVIAHAYMVKAVDTTNGVANEKLVKRVPPNNWDAQLGFGHMIIFGENGWVKPAGAAEWVAWTTEEMKIVRDSFTAGFENNSNHMASAECLQPREYLGEQFTTFQTIGKDSAGAVLTAIYLVNTETQLKWILTDKKGENVEGATTQQFTVDSAIEIKPPQ